MVGSDLVVVDDKGEPVAYLYDFEVMTATGAARENLMRNGYRVDFAKWDDYGSMVGLIEKFDGEGQ